MKSTKSVNCKSITSNEMNAGGKKCNFYLDSFIRVSVITERIVKC